MVPGVVHIDIGNLLLGVVQSQIGNLVLDAHHTHIGILVLKPRRARITNHLDECGPCLKQFGLEQAVKAAARGHQRATSNLGRRWAAEPARGRRRSANQ